MRYVHVKTVGELRKALKAFDDDLPIGESYTEEMGLEATLVITSKDGSAGLFWIDLETFDVTELPEEES